MWQDYFKLPFKVDSYFKTKVFDANNQLVLDIKVAISDEALNKILAFINGEATQSKTLEIEYDKDNGII